MTTMKSTDKRLLFIDIETYSEVDLLECGVYRYVDDASFEVLIFGYAYDDDDVTVIDLAQGESIPNKVLKDLNNPSILKIAHNANFERTCLSKTIKYMPPEEWLCTAVLASRLGLPRSLKDVGDAIGIREDEAKLKTGKALIQYFSKPCKPTKVNGGRTRNYPRHDMEKWNLYKTYNGQDVVAERAIYKKLIEYPQTTKEEEALWCLDQRMNELGVMVDTQLIDNILNYSDSYKDRLLDEAKEISGLDNPQSISQAKGWLLNKGLDITSLTKDDVSFILANIKDMDIPEDDKELVIRFLKIRQELGKTSVSKYEAMDRSYCSDLRIRGMLQFYGANRTGRWAGRIVQLQNLPQNHLSDIHFSRNLIANNEFEIAELCYPSMMNLFSQLIRTSFIPHKDTVFVVADYSAIEARMIGWLASEEWVMEVFRTSGKIYEATAAQMFHVPIESVTKGSDLRKKGKVATLACGYQGGVGALTAMDSKGDIPEDEKQSIIDMWRAANPNIVKFWWDTENNAIQAIENPGLVVKGPRGIEFQMFLDTLFIKLPSGRRIAYKGAKIKKSDGRKSIRYMGTNQKTNKWEEVETYGGKIVENITQATARDCLGVAMLNLAKHGYMPQFHVHDEVIIEVPIDKKDECMKDITDIMRIDYVNWTKDLILKAEGYFCDFYMKD